MRGIVIYHSITGNTKKIAVAIHRGMNQAGGQCDIEQFKDVTTNDLLNYDLIGLGSPVMRNRELFNVTNFIELVMRSVDGKHGFAFCTHGALPGRYLSRVVSGMTQRGLTIIGWNDWFGSVYYPAMPKPYFTDGHPDSIDLREAEEFGIEMVKRSERIFNGETQLIPRFPRGKEYDAIYEPTPGPSFKILNKFSKIRDGIELKVNPVKCKYPKCTICIDNCPMNCIEFTDPPTFYHVNCERCWVCEQACPNGAIEVDWQPFHDAHFPMIKPVEESLKVFEERGTFRRLIPPDDIGWDNFPWQSKKHPRIKLV